MIREFQKRFVVEGMHGERRPRAKQIMWRGKEQSRTPLFSFTLTAMESELSGLLQSLVKWMCGLDEICGRLAFLQMNSRKSFIFAFLLSVGVFGNQSGIRDPSAFFNNSTMSPSPAQMDPFYTQGLESPQQLLSFRWKIIYSWFFR